MRSSATAPTRGNTSWSYAVGAFATWEPNPPRDTILRLPVSPENLPPMPTIDHIHAREVLDSRGKPTVEAEVTLSS